MIWYRYDGCIQEERNYQQSQVVAEHVVDTD